MDVKTHFSVRLFGQFSVGQGAKQSICVLTPGSTCTASLCAPSANIGTPVVVGSSPPPPQASPSPLVFRGLLTSQPVANNGTVVSLLFSDVFGQLGAQTMSRDAMVGCFGERLMSSAVPTYSTISPLDATLLPAAMLGIAMGSSSAAAPPYGFALSVAAANAGRCSF